MGSVKGWVHDGVHVGGDVLFPNYFEEDLLPLKKDAFLTILDFQLERSKQLRFQLQPTPEKRKVASFFADPLTPV